MVDVTSSSGQALVLGTQASTVATSLDPSNIGLDGSALSQIGVLTAGGSLVKLTGNVGGSVGALLNLRDTSLPATSGQLDQLANTFRDAVNTVQTDPSGKDLNGAVGTQFFSGTGAAGLTVALTDPRTIAAARSSNLGDNTGALALAQVANTTFPALGGATLNDYFGTLQGQAGSAASAADSEATVQQNLSSNLEAQRDSVSGVNLEQEFTNLVQFQRGYQAAADLISVSNKMLDDLLSLVP
jgi:flagellar hook-associated protein 1 FlgK